MKGWECVFCCHINPNSARSCMGCHTSRFEDRDQKRIINRYDSGEFQLRNRVRFSDGRAV